AVLFVTIVAAIVTGWVTRKRGPIAARVVLMCGAAYASHLLLDWLGIDRFPPSGLQLLWPFSDRWFISGLDIFEQTERRHLLTLASWRQNGGAFGREAIILLPILVGLWRVRVKALAGLAPQLVRRDHPAQERTRAVL